MLQGAALHIVNFDKAGGRLSGEGQIESVHYLAAQPARKGLLERLFP